MKIIEFAQEVGKLKNLQRSGWVRNKVPDSESVAEHIFRVAVLALILAPKLGVDQSRAVKMALIHDVGEAQSGDIITKKGAKVLPNYQNKIQEERAGLAKILALSDSEEYLRLFDEFEENKTRTARFIKQLDKLEMAIQAWEYENKYNVKLSDFFEDAESVVIDKPLKEILNQIKNLRKND